MKTIKEWFMKPKKQEMSDHDKRITGLQLKYELLKDVEIKELTKKILDLEKIVNKMMSVKTEKTFKRNIELVWYINKTNGTPTMTDKKQADFESIKELVYMGEYAYIFKCKTKSSFEYLFYIGYYKD
jgi:hypothetical protein